MGSNDLRSWFDVAANNGRVFSRKWVVLNNGVLWIHSGNESSSFAEEVIPLQDAEICCPASSGTDDNLQSTTVFSVRMGLGEDSRMVYICAPSEDEYRSWISAILEAARVWRARRETASLCSHRRGAGETRPPPPLEDVEECSQRVWKCLAQFSDNCTELRLLTRKAVTQTGEEILPRFHRRAVNDAVEKAFSGSVSVWRVSERVRSAANEDVHAGAGAGVGVLVALQTLRDQVGVFLTYCSLLQDLQTMLRQVCDVDALAVIRQLSLLRAALRLRRPRGHEVAHAAALAAVEAILRRCWMELREHNLHAVTVKESDVARQERGVSGSAGMAPTLKRDMSVSVSMRRASKRVRSDGQQQAELHLQDPPGVQPEQVCAEGSRAQGMDIPGSGSAGVAMTSPIIFGTAVPHCSTATAPLPEPIPLRIRRKTYTPGTGLDDDSNDDGEAEGPFVVQYAVEVKSLCRPRTPESHLLNIPVTPATPNGGGRRALWAEAIEVQQSGLLERLSPSDIVLQEAKFEVLSSEESYLRALDILAQRVNDIDAFHDPLAISDIERDTVSNFLDSARACSLRLVSTLRELWSRDLMLRGLCGLMHREATGSGSLLQYAVIVGMQPRAASVLSKIGSAETAQLLAPLSLPAQRVSRLPLLLAAILRRLDQRSSEAVICRAALDRLNQIVFECNESLRRAEHSERMCALSRKLLAEKTPRKKVTSWRERKGSVFSYAKHFFQKSSYLSLRTVNARTSTSSLTPLTDLEHK